MNSAYLILGGNIGKREKFLEKAILQIENRIGKIIKKSSRYETKAWPARTTEVLQSVGGNTKQADFLNQVILVETILHPQDLLIELLKIEKSLGRIRSGKKWEERIIDIDILFYLTGGIKNEPVILNEENLKIPHPFLHLRRFTLEPLNEIAPAMIHPVLKKTISELLKVCTDKLKVMVIDSH